MRIRRKLYLSLIGVLLLPAQGWPIQGSTIVRFHVQGNLNAKMRPNETAKLIVSVETEGPGVLDFRISEFPPRFINFDSDEMECAATVSCSMTDTIHVNPERVDYGHHSFNIFARLFVDGVQVDERSRRVRIDVIPKMLPEPPFTATDANQLCWSPFEPTFRYELVTTPLRGSNTLAVPLAYNNAAGSFDSCDVVAGLPEGVPFQYFVKATDVATGLEIESDRVTSIQDQTPPPAAGVENFLLDVGNQSILLRWPRKTDAVSFIEKYVIWRRRAGQGGPAAIDTLSFFPVGNISPVSYYPVTPRIGQQVYLDSPSADSVISARLGSDFQLQAFPMNILRGAMMLRTGLSDRWNEHEDFLSFDLFADSHIFIAYDVDGLNFALPVWLRDHFRAVGKQVVVGGNRLRLYKSLDVFKEGRVTFGGNFARAASLINKEPLQYLVFVQPVDRIFPFAGGDEIEYADHLTEADDASIFRYSISTVDAAGNLVDGPESGQVAADLSSRCRPELVRWSAFNDGTTHFSKEFSNLICLRDPALDLECNGFRDTDSLRFQAARLSASLFESGEPGKEFFDSQWLSLQPVGNEVCFNFDLLPADEEPNFTHAKRYFYRVRGKDRFGNVSVWSDTVSAIQDAFPPPDILSLRATHDAFDGNTGGCNRLNWTGGNDAVSGTQSFVIFQGPAGGQLAAIDTIPGARQSYCDSLSSFQSNEIVSYKIGSIDNVGNVRPAEDSNHEVTIRPLVGPAIAFDNTSLMFCSDGRARVNLDTLRVFWSNFDVSEVAGYKVDISKPNGSLQTKLLDDGTLKQVICPLDAGDGFYRIRVRAFYTNRDTSIYSNELAIRKKVVLAPVSDVRVAQDTKPTGDILLSWSHPELDEIEAFEVFVWPAGASEPAEPTAVLTGSETNWTRHFSDGELVAYQCDNYAVRARDCFGLTSELQPVVMQFSNRPPVFDPALTQVNDDRLTVCWQRPRPRFKEDDTFESTVTVYQDSIAGSVFDTATFINESCFTLFSPPPMHNYIFKVREQVLDDLGQACADTFKSGLSDRIIVPFMNLPRSVVFSAQPLPVHPDSVTGTVFLDWDLSGNEESLFSIEIRAASEMVSRIINVRMADTLRVRGLDLGKSYEFDIFAMDSLGQRSEMSATQQVDFSPRWVFTPKPETISPQCFRDGVTVKWQWLQEMLVPATDSFGADSVIVQVSVDPAFGFRFVERRLGLTRKTTFNTARELPFINEQNSRLFIRVRAKDRWGHLSPWSTTYEELGFATGLFDNIAPGNVTSRLDSVKAPLFGAPGRVDVYLSWEDGSDNCSGIWFYEVARNDSVVRRDTSRVQTHLFADRDLMNDQSLLDNVWRVFAVDSVGNRQTVANPSQVSFTVAAPDSGGCVNDTTFCWAPIQFPLDLPVFYFVEGARFASLFGNPVTNVFSGPLDTLCFNFEVPWEQVFWRVKARVGSMESAWSDTFFCDLSQNNVLLTTFEGDPELPEKFALRQNYPNPFNPSTTIEFAIPATTGRATRVVLDIFNIQGQRVRSLVNENKPPATYSITWDGRDDFGGLVGSGLYIYQIQAGDFVRARKMLFVK